MSCEVEDLQVEALLEGWTLGEPESLQRLMDLLYNDLRSLARKFMSLESPTHTLQPTAVVNEVYMRLVSRRSVQWENRDHFFRTAGGMMRRFLVDYSRRRKSGKRGKGIEVMALESLEQDGVAPLMDSPIEDILALERALEKLNAQSQQTYKVVEFKYFLGLTNQDMAKLLGISSRTVNREWKLGRNWLRRELSS